MIVKRQLLKWITGVFFFLISSITWAIPSNLPSESAIHLNPLEQYHFIEQQLTQQNSSNSHNFDYLWWLLRKAQAENELYFHQDLVETVNQALPLISQLTPAELSGSFYFFAGLNALRAAQFKQAGELFEKVIQLAQQSDNTRLYILALSEQAYTKSLIELYQTSLTDIQAAYVDAFRLNDPYLIAKINETYGAIYGYMKDYEKSIQYYQKALTAYEQLHYPNDIAEAIYGLAATYRYWKKYDEAIKYFTLYRQKIDYTPNKALSFFSAYGIAMTLAEKGDCQQALPSINQALQLDGLIDYNAELYKRQASCYIRLGDLAAAENALMKAEQTFAQLPDLKGTRWVLENQQIRSQLAHAKGDVETAFQLLSDYHQSSVDLLEQQSEQRLLQVRSLLELERRDIEISLLKQRAQVQALTLQNQQQHNEELSYLVILGVGFIMMILIFVLFQRKNNQRIYELAIRDSLTQLYNRRYIASVLSDMLAKQKDNPIGFSILLFDIDDFKFINDRYGHPVGDTVLQRIAEIGLTTFRQEDTMSRLGGDEFLCILPRSTMQESLQVAERLLTKIKQTAFKSNKGDLFSITVSIGIYHIAQGQESLEQVLTRVDRALYQAKAKGKNQVAILDETNNQQSHT
jgi:diguanylate cyclase (GGDEF)-like protein